MESRKWLWSQTFVPRLRIYRRRGLLSFEVHSQPRRSNVHGKDTGSHIRKHQLIHDRLSRFQEFLSKRLKEPVFVYSFPLDVKSCPTRELRIDGQDGSAISFKEGVSMCQITEYFSRMVAKIGLVLSEVQSMLSS